MKEIVEIKISKAMEKEREERQKELRSKRRNFISNIESYWDDIEAVIRVEKMKENKSELLDYNNDLVVSEKVRLLNRYNNLRLVAKEIENGYCSRFWGMVREVIKSEEDKNNRGKDRKYKFNWRNEKEVEIDLISEDGIMVDEIIWNSLQLKTYLAFMKELGFKEIYYKNSGSNCLEVVSELVSLGGIVYKSWKVDEKSLGLIINIEGIELDKTLEGYMDEAIEIERQEKEKKNK